MDARLTTAEAADVLAITPAAALILLTGTKTRYTRASRRAPWLWYAEDVKHLASLLNKEPRTKNDEPATPHA